MHDEDVSNELWLLIVLFESSPLIWVQSPKMLADICYTLYYTTDNIYCPVDTTVQNAMIKHLAVSNQSMISKYLVRTRLLFRIIQQDKHHTYLGLSDFLLGWS